MYRLISESNAKQYIERIIKKTEDISNFPFIGRVVPEASDNKIREIISINHRIIYRINLIQ
ncbi:type II toxin-antitoxin system RelE/ParE family toxin [Desulfuribacillus stibiiarsenatis]|uniref:type II toxin-antitoxin system RelE/ParE family toxin n=1 Tax=Desulfuribacillus stibiiarsenatis TaxID=1390249 RepID=UPI00345B6EC9